MGNSPSSAVWDFNSNRPLGQYIRRRSSGSTRANSASGRSSNTGVSRHVPRRVTRRNRSPSHHSVHRAKQVDGNKSEANGENLDECPICFAYFPMLNTTCCCNKALCTNCFLHIQRHGKRKSCPFCNRPKLEVMFFGPRTDEERFLEYVEDISLELRKRASLKDETEFRFRGRQKKLVLSNNSDYYETKGLSLQNVCNILQQEEISEEDLAVIIALHRSYMEHKSKSRESSTEKKDESLGGSSHSEHLVDMDEDDSSFLDIFSLSGSSSHLYKPSLSTSCPTHFNQLNQTRCSEDSVATGNSSSRLVDIEDPERSESTTFYLDVPPISPSLHFMSKSQSSETQE
ncbi:hypothetical protein Gasu2_14880 [Galdieria sulphuraria]|nr:hypothetical protein Gasu2_14880 [Galdieria sulphuraria]